MKRMGWGVLALMSFLTGMAFAEGEVFDVNEQLMKGYDRPAFRAMEILKMPEYTVSAIGVKEEIKTHRHTDADHVLYIISGRGTVTLDEKPVALKPGTVVYIPKGVPHSIKAEGGEVTILDFSAYASAK